MTGSGQTQKKVEKRGVFCRILSSLKHPNIMLFLGCHFQYPCFYMVTELVEGPLGKNNLRKVIDDLDIRPGFNLSLR